MAIYINTDTMLGKSSWSIITNHSKAWYVNKGVGHGAKEMGFSYTHNMDIKLL